MDLIYITGSQNKADFLEKFLDVPFERLNTDLDEIQSLDLRQLIEHKVRQAYEITKKPVVVEDTSLEFCALGRLPGPFIKFFCQELPNEELCTLVQNKDRSAIARCMFAYYDGENLEVFEGMVNGLIAETPSGKAGFGWDKIFIADGNSVTNGSLDEMQYQEMYLSLKPIDALGDFLKRR